VFLPSSNTHKEEDICMPSVLIVEDHALMRATLRLLLADIAAPISECDNGLAVCAAYTAHQPDWVLMDIELPGQDGITATRQLLSKQPTARVLIVTSFDDAEIRKEAATAGACGYVLKENLMELRHWLQVTN
jgi:DNA-binding NarL/FixJ family response regulator